MHMKRIMIVAVLLLLVLATAGAAECSPWHTLEYFCDGCQGMKLEWRFCWEGSHGWDEYRNVQIQLTCC